MSIIGCAVINNLGRTMNILSRFKRRFFGTTDPVDAQTIKVMQHVLRRDSCGVDVGANTGTILRHIVRLAPEGTHFALEPIPALAEQLARCFPNVHVLSKAAADRTGVTRFHWFSRLHGFSGIRRREDVPDTATEIDVHMDTLDHLIPIDVRVDFLKVDVEGAEGLVFLGARNLLQRCHPTLVFEHGVGGADIYGTTPGQVHDLLCGECHYTIAPLQEWTPKCTGLTKEAFEAMFRDGQHFMFVAQMCQE